MKKQIAAVMLAATLLPCNVYASEDVNNSYQIGLLSYELSSDWIESEDPIKMYKEAMTFFNGNASLEISVFEADTDPYMISEDDKDDVIDACFQIFTEGFSEMDEYEKLSSEYLNSSLNTQAYFSSFTFDHKNVKGVGMTYNLYYEKSIYNVIFFAPLNSLSDYTSVLTDFDDSLKPVEIISDAATVQKVQEALNQKGYNCGTSDGIAGANTESAVKSYQKDFNLLETGKITNKLLESLSIQSEESDDIEETETSQNNSLLQSYIKSGDIYSGDRSKILGKYGYISIPKETLRTVTAEEFIEFAQQQATYSSVYNWVSIICDDGTGILFSGCDMYYPTYGKLDSDGSILETYGDIIWDFNTESYSYNSR